MQNESFSSRWGLILSALGMAIGAGNLWRFPRLAGQYGGTFIMLWMLFLLVWSIPILMAEFSIGKKFKKGVIGAMGTLLGPRFAWMGFFIAACTLGITFYYSTVTAWALQYLGFAFNNLVSEMAGNGGITGLLGADPGYLDTHWDNISYRNWGTVGLHVFSVGLAVFILYKGVQKGLEAVNKFLIPAVFVILLLISTIALNMDNGIKGLEYMFDVRLELFASPVVWLEAISQSAWSTGAGWGLMMTLSSYSRAGEDVTLNTFISGFGNNSASIVSGMAILPAVFAMSPDEASAVNYLQAGNQALTFTVIPKIFAGMPFGAFLTLLFFVTLFFAAFSSLLSMNEMFIRIIGDLGYSRHASTLRAGMIAALLGIPSAYHLDVFSNQDWVWGLGLVISGLFIVFSVWKHGVGRFKSDFIDADADFRVSLLYFKSCMGVNVVFGVVLIWWWMSQGYDANPWFLPDGTWNLLSVYSNASIVTQWGLVLLVGLVLNRFLYRRFVKG